MVNKLTSFNAVSNPFGSQIDLHWRFPTTLPENYKVYIFQRSQSDVDQVEDIDRYFDNIDDLEGYNYNKLFVIDNIDNPQQTTLMLLQLRNGLTYYYKAVIRDEDTGEYSETVSANAVPDFDVLVNVKDGKDIVAQAIKKMIDGLTNPEGKKLSLNKEIEVEKTFPMEEIERDRFIVTRYNGSNTHTFWGDILETTRDGSVFGNYDSDIIRFTFLTSAGNERRDLWANIIRARKVALRKMIKALGAEDVQITIEGDYYNPQFHGENSMGFTVVFAVLIQNMNLSEVDPIENHFLTEIKVK